MSDILAAASLILAIMTTLFSLIYPLVSGILDLKPQPHAIDNKTNYEKALIVRNTKLFPLTFASLMMTLVFLPELVRQLTISWLAIKQDGLSFRDYDTVMACFITVSLFMIALFIAILDINIKFVKQMKLLNPGIK